MTLDLSVLLWRVVAKDLIRPLFSLYLKTSGSYSGVRVPPVVREKAQGVRQILSLILR